MRQFSGKYRLPDLQTAANRPPPHRAPYQMDGPVSVSERA